MLSLGWYWVVVNVFRTHELIPSSFLLHISFGFVFMDLLCSSSSVTWKWSMLTWLRSTESTISTRVVMSSWSLRLFVKKYVVWSFNSNVTLRITSDPSASLPQRSIWPRCPQEEAQERPGGWWNQKETRTWRLLYSSCQGFGNIQSMTGDQLYLSVGLY